MADETIEATGVPLPGSSPISVRQPTGGEISVIDAVEVAHYNSQRDKYLQENRFTTVADLADLDSLLLQELLNYRWGRQLASGVDYDGNFLGSAEEEQFRRNKNDSSKVIAALKTSLNLTRASRDANEGSTGEYLRQLRTRAREFGVHREDQAVAAITLMNTLSSIVGTYDRSNETERRKVGVENEVDIVAWVRDTMIPAFHKVDADFRAGSQKYWSQL